MCEHLNFLVEQIHDGWLITVEGRDAHGHFRKRRAALNLIRELRSNHLPFGYYSRECAKRILTEEEFNSLIDRRKEKYINVNKGIPKKKRHGRGF